VTVRFEHTAVVATPIDVVFDLSLDMDAHVASMARSRERIVGGVSHGRIGLGDQVTFRARHFGIPFLLTSRVTELDEPHRFVDEQVEGPFRSFRHEHLFRHEDGATVMVDRVRFDAPVGFVGDIAERVLLGRYLRRLIGQRSRHTKREAERRAS
jgi:ligand-binding SRPBCC domain-containing protein